MKKLRILFIILALCLLGGYLLKTPLMKLVYPVKYEQEVMTACDEFDVSPELVFAVIKTESSFREDAVSHKAAHGLMQITYDTFNWAKEKLGGEEDFEDIFNPYVNIRYGTYILSYLIRDFGSEEVALAAYNAGRGNVQKWLRDEAYSSDGSSLHHIPFKETREYVVKVEKSKDAYLKLYPDIF